MSVSVHNVARTGFGKGTNELYDRARPSYPAPALSAIRASLNIAQSSFNVLEVGSGTGIFTRALLAHPEWSTAVREFRAIDPSEGMREQFSRTVDDSRVSVEEGTFEQTHVADGWADVIIIAQAFHWCPDYDKAIAEFARALNPTGRLGFVWNLEDVTTAWVGQLNDVLKPSPPGIPKPGLDITRQAFQTPSYLKYFQPSEEKSFKHTVPTTAQGVIDRAFSRSYISIRSDFEKARLAKDLNKILDRGDDKVWVDEKEGTISYPHTTTVVITRKK